MTVVSGDPTPRPWLDHYPSGIRWDLAVNTTPVHEQVLAVAARTPRAVALDFLGAETTYGQLAKSINAFAAALQAFASQNANVRIVDSRGTLTSRRQWQNEIHPTRSGFALIANACWVPALTGILT